MPRLIYREGSTTFFFFDKPESTTCQRRKAAEVRRKSSLSLFREIYLHFVGNLRASESLTKRVKNTVIFTTCFLGNFLFAPIFASDLELEIVNGTGNFSEIERRRKKMIRDLMHYLKRLIGVTEPAGSATSRSLGVERKTESKQK